MVKSAHAHMSRFRSDLEYLLKSRKGQLNEISHYLEFSLNFFSCSLVHGRNEWIAQSRLMNNFYRQRLIKLKQTPCNNLDICHNFLFFVKQVNRQLQFNGEFFAVSGKFLSCAHTWNSFAPRAIYFWTARRFNTQKLKRSFSDLFLSGHFFHIFVYCEIATGIEKEVWKDAGRVQDGIS